MIKFGLQSVKYLSLLLACLVLSCGIILLVRAYSCKSIWDENSMLGTDTGSVSAITFYLSFVLIVLGVIGLLALCFGRIGFLIIYDVLLAIAAVVLIIWGLIVWIDVNSDHAKTLIKLRSTINGLDPARLDKVQTNFKCCGIDKYTDYLIIWKDWNMSYTAQFTTVVARGAGTVPPPVKLFRKKSWKAVPFSIEDEFGGELTTELTTEMAENEPTRVWKSGKMARLNEEDIVPGEAKARASAADMAGTFQDSMDKAYQGFWGNLSDIIHGISAKILGKVWDFYDWITPTFVQKWLSLLGSFIHRWVDWMLTPAKYVYKWWFGSGWDKVLFDHFGHIKVLPLSCCKNPSTPCQGDMSDTWMDGCRMKVVFSWKSCNLELGLLCMCFFSVLFLAVYVTSIFIGGLREKYMY